MRGMYASSAGLRRFGSAVLGMIPDPDSADDVISVSPTSGNGAVLALDPANFSRHLLIGRDIVTNQNQQARIEFRKQSDGLFEQGATDYRMTEYTIGSTETDPLDFFSIQMNPGPNMGPGPWNCMIDIVGASFVCNTSVYSRDLDTATRTHDGQVNSTEIHDQVRIRLGGAASYVSGTFYMLRME